VSRAKSVPLNGDALRALAAQFDQVDSSEVIAVSKQAVRPFLEEVRARIEEDFMLANEAMGSSHAMFDVTLEETETGFTIRASGEDVYFLEFGIGDDTAPDKLAAQANAEISPGSWSRTHPRDTKFYNRWAKQWETRHHEMGPYAEHGHWHYNGVDYKGVPGSHSMAFADDYINEHIAEEIQKGLKEILG
jgi:hypothetical protein